MLRGQNCVPATERFFKSRHVPRGKLSLKISIPYRAYSVPTFIVYVICLTVACRLTDWSLKQSSYDDFDWSFGESCTKTRETGPCAETNFNNDGEFLSTRQEISH